MICQHVGKQILGTGNHGLSRPVYSSRLTPAEAGGVFCPVLRAGLFFIMHCVIEISKLAQFVAGSSLHIVAWSSLQASLLDTTCCASVFLPGYSPSSSNVEKRLVCLRLQSFLIKVLIS